MSVAVVVIESAVSEDTFGPWMADDGRVAVASTKRVPEIVRWIDHVQASHALVVGRSAHKAAISLAANLVAGARPKVSVATRALPTTSIALAAAGVSAHAVERDPVRLLAAFDQLVTNSISGVVLKTVTKLEHPKPSIKMHVKSLFGRDFVATTTPEPLVSQTLNLPATGEPILVAAEAGSADFQRVSRMVGGHPVEPVPQLASPETAYGSAGAEFVALAQVGVPSSVKGQCPVCHLGVLTDVCPYCHVHHRVSEPA